jgi:hypothetical protein
MTARAGRAARLPAAEQVLGRPMTVAVACALALVLVGALASPQSAAALPLPSPADLLPGGGLPGLDPSSWVVELTNTQWPLQRSPRR